MCFLSSRKILAECASSAMEVKRGEILGLGGREGEEEEVFLDFLGDSVAGDESSDCALLVERVRFLLWFLGSWKSPSIGSSVGSSAGEMGT